MLFLFVAILGLDVVYAVMVAAMARQSLRIARALMPVGCTQQNQESAA
jgi:hypothetical protein